MEEVTFQLEQFDFKGPLDLLLTLIQKNKINITDLPIALLCDQYLAAIAEMEQMDMELASDFLLMASELMYIKSKMMLPREEKEEKDPRMELTDALLRYQAAKEGAAKMTKLYAVHSARMVKDTDEISIDRTYVADQQITSLCAAIRRINAYQESMAHERKATFTPMISRPIVPVELKIVGILKHLNTEKQSSLQTLLADAVSLPDMIAIFLGVLELVKMRQILIVDEPEDETALHRINTRFVLNDNPPKPEKPDKDNHTTESETQAS